MDIQESCPNNPQRASLPTTFDVLVAQELPIWIVLKDRGIV